MDLFIHRKKKLMIRRSEYILILNLSVKFSFQTKNKKLELAG